MKEIEANLSEKKAFCAITCLAGENPCLWLNLVKQGKFLEAWQEIVDINPLPAVMGRICPHICQNPCQRQLLDEVISINALERFLGDQALMNGWQVQTLTKKKKLKVAVVGSGPAGLSCAYQLGRLGYQVTIFEELPLIGGLLTTGIPEFRLSRHIVEEEINNNILSLGVKTKTNARVDQPTFDLLEKKFDAVFVAVGLQKSRKLNIPGEDAENVLYGLDFLRNITLGKPTKLGKNVIVIGGGNTAIDVARTARKLGSQVTIFYRRSEVEMPAIKSEVAQAEAEGIEVRELIAPRRVLIRGGRTLLECQRMKLGEPDESGRKRPIPVEGTIFWEEFGNLIIAAGEEKEESFNLDAKNIFINHDAATVAQAIKFGREKAKEITKFLQNKKMVDSNDKNPLLVKPERLSFYLTAKKRVKNIRSKASLAQKEAKRCFGCGFEINGQAKVVIDQERCKGCSLCVEVCPYQLIKLSDSFNNQGYHPAFSRNPEKCRGCTLCVLVCPDAAIEIYKEG